MNYYLSVLQNYATFKGRARRSEYWFFLLFHIIITLIVFSIGVALDTYSMYYVYYLATIIPGLAVGVRRMHDVGKSGWFLLIPIYNLILACTEGITGENEYGPDPKRIY